MAFGFPASYVQRVNLIATRTDARAAAIYLFNLLGWKFETPDRETYIVVMPMSGMSWGEKITISLAESGILKIESKCIGLQIIDWGKNRRNIERFLPLYEAKIERDAKSDKDDLRNLYSDGKTPLERALDTYSE